MMPNNTDSHLFKQIVWGVEHEAFNSPLGQCLLRNWQLGVCDEESAAMILDLVRPLQTRDAFGELCPFRKPRLSRGDFLVGQDTDRDPVWLTTQLLNAGLVELGNTGASKTNISKNLILGVARSLIGLWVSDMYKKEIRHLRPFLRQFNRDLVIARPHQLKVNLLQPDGNDVRAHLSLVLDILKRVLGLPPRAMTILRMIFHQLYEEFGNFNGKTDAWPALYDGYERVRTAKGLNPAAKEAILDRLGAFLIALGPGVGAYRLAWRPSDLSRYFIDFEFAEAAEQVKSAILSYYLFSVLHHRVRQGVPNAKMDFWLIFEDGQRFFSSRGEDTGDITPAEELAGLIRGTGTGIAFTA